MQTVKWGQEDLSSESDIAQEVQVPSSLLHVSSPSIWGQVGGSSEGLHRGWSEGPSLREEEQHNLGPALITG